MSIQVKKSRGEKFLDALYRGDVPNIAYKSRRKNSKNRKLEMLEDKQGMTELAQWINEFFPAGIHDE